MIIGSLIVGIGAMAMYASIPAVFGLPYTIVIGFVIAVITILIGIIISLVGLYGRLVPGVGELAKTDNRFSTASTLIRIGYVWGAIMLIVGLIIIIAGIVAGVAIGFTAIGRPHGVHSIAGGVLGILVAGGVLGIVGAILVLIGYIGVIVLAFKFNETENDSLYLVAGILFIIGLLIPLITFIAWILMYIALGRSIDKRKAVPQQVASTQTPSLV